MPGYPAVFLDLHGTLGDERGDPWGLFTQFDLYNFAADAIQILNEAGLLVVVLTNQAPIARGLFTLDQFWQRWGILGEQLLNAGARVDAVYCCPHDESDDCNCRKPRRGLVDMALEALDIETGSSFVVGDRGSADILLAQAIGARGVLVKTGDGEGSLGPYRYLWAHVEPDHIALNALEAARWITAQTEARQES
jgi:D-glycero-D-manno-heptose 1,7-bisphosphate phosphatase